MDLVFDVRIFAAVLYFYQEHISDHDYTHATYARHDTLKHTNLTQLTDIDLPSRIYRCSPGLSLMIAIIPISPNLPKTNVLVIHVC